MPTRYMKWLDVLLYIALAVLLVACAIAFIRNPQSIMGGH